MVTAGHCFLSGQSAWSTGGGGSFGSVVSRFNYPNYDMELLGNGSYGPYIYEGNATGYGTHVISAGDPGVTGYTYCSSGQTSTESCDHTVLSLTATVCAYGSLGCSYGDIAASNTSVTSPVRRVPKP